MYLYVEMGYILSADGTALISVTQDTVGEFIVPASVTKIEVEAFRNCTFITSITMPNSVTTINDRAFYSCTGLNTLTLSEGLTAIPTQMCYYCSSLTTINIPAAVAIIGVEAFSGCEALSYVTFSPNSTVWQVRDSAFKDCAQLLTITLPASVTSLGSAVFASCTQLSSVTFENPSTVTIIGDGAFMNCFALTSFTIPSGLTVLSYNLFAFSGLTTILIPATITALSIGTFYGCNQLVSVTFSGTSTITSIPASVFNTCTGLTSIRIPNSVETIGDAAFNGCISLTTVLISEESKLKTIGEQAFYGSPITTISLPNGVILQPLAFGPSSPTISYFESASYDPFCFFGQTPILTPAGYRPIASLREGDYVQTADGRPVQIQRIHVQKVAPTAANQPIRIPRGYAGATQTIYVSPKHRIRGPAGFAEASKQPGLHPRPFENTLTYYNLELPCWDTDNLVAAGVVAESMAPVRRMEMTMAEFATLIRREYGAAAATPAVIAKIMKTCKFLPDGRVAAPVMNRR